jgi:Trk-type K+ transport system membrane component
LVLGTFYLYFAETGGSLQGKSGYGKLVTAFMLAVTPRTAGFNSYDLNLMTTPAILVTILLMWIGASPGSTGGGIKTTTFAVGVLNAISIARNKLRMELFRREIASESVRRAFAVMLLSLLVIGLGILVMAYLEPKVPILKVVFECFSAYGTVGLSLSLTSTLSEGSKIVLVVLMFLGRVNTLTLLIVLFDKVPKQKYRYPEENIYIT